MRSVVDERISFKAVARGKPTVSTGRKAAVLGARGRVRRTPPGAKSGAWRHKGSAGTWESHRSPCQDVRSGGPDDQRPWRGGGASTRPRALRGHHQRTAAGKVSGSERRAKRPEKGRVAVCAAHSTGEGGEPSPTGPTGGQAMPGSTFCWMARRERPGEPQPSPHNSSGLRHKPPAIPMGSLRPWPT
jgi:hypothetical protein